MNTKQIISVIAAFIIGGFIGFFINGQICHKHPSEPKQHCEHNRPDYHQHDKNGDPRRHGCHRQPHQVPPFVFNILDSLNLSDEQKTQIEKIVRENKPQACKDSCGHEQFAKDSTRQNCRQEAREIRRQKIAQIKAVLTEDQQKVFDEKMKEMKEHRHRHHHEKEQGMPHDMPQK